LYGSDSLYYYLWTELYSFLIKEIRNHKKHGLKHHIKSAPAPVNVAPVKRIMPALATPSHHHYNLQDTILQGALPLKIFSS